MPAGDRVHEILCVFVLTKGQLRIDAKDATAGRFEKWADVATVLAVVDFDELLPNGAILNFFDGAFQDDGFVRFFSADDNVRISFCTASGQ